MPGPRVRTRLPHRVKGGAGPRPGDRPASATPLGTRPIGRALATPTPGRRMRPPPGPVGLTVVAEAVTDLIGCPTRPQEPRLRRRLGNFPRRPSPGGPRARKEPETED